MDGTPQQVYRGHGLGVEGSAQNQNSVVISIVNYDYCCVIISMNIVIMTIAVLPLAGLPSTALSLRVYGDSRS